LFFSLFISFLISGFFFFFLFLLFFHSTIPIVFNSKNPEAITDAHRCLEELTKEGLKRGFVPYRINIDQQQWLLDKDTDFWQTVNLLKKSLDPNNILSISRYNPK
jgi:4-cresol dehydrogenase (hydroxylating)